MKTLAAYYYAFDATGVDVVDEILAAVADAGRRSHHTDGWSDGENDQPSSADRIQQAANKAAAEYLRLRKVGS